MGLPFTIMPVLPFRHGAHPANIVASFLAFDPLVTFDFLLLGPEDFKQGMQDAPLTKRAFPSHEILLLLFLAFALPTDIPTGLLAFDPSVIFNVLSLGPNQLNHSDSSFQS